MSSSPSTYSKTLHTEKLFFDSRVAIEMELKRHKDRLAYLLEKSEIIRKQLSEKSQPGNIVARAKEHVILSTEERSFS